jgi:hypothetical protein
VTDPGGGYGWRTARHVPRRRGGVLGLGQIAEQALQEHRPLCVLLLPQVLEAFALRERAEDLLTAPGVVAVDPARLSYTATARLPQAVGDGLASVQARRLRLPGEPRAVAIFHPLQYPLARALLAAHPDGELWYGRAGAEPEPAPRLRERLEDLHRLATERAALRFGTDPAPAHAQNLPLWERMERLGVESGRLGSERPDVG